MSATVPGTLRAFYVENRQQLYTYALALTRQREAAEDAIQQAFARLLRRGRRLRPSWLSRSSSTDRRCSRG
ncbi:MAG TPA: sigma factor [Lacunisphaera sp.]|nr:sigma factor [Lacunisphaera sp.]